MLFFLQRGDKSRIPRYTGIYNLSKEITMVLHHFEEGFEASAEDRQESVEVSREFLDQFPGGLFRYRADEIGKLDYVNNNLIEMFGCENVDEFKKLTGTTFRGMVHPDDWERVDESINMQVRDSHNDRVVYRINHAKGDLIWVDDSGHLVIDENGEAWFYVTVIDITESILEHEELERAHERLDILTALSNDVVFDIECKTGKTQVYGDFQDRFGRAPKQEDFVVHRRCQKECNLDINEHSLSHLLEQISENSLVDFETSSVGENDEPIWYRYQSVVLYDENGEPYRHVGRLLDTQEMAMRESQFRRKAERDSLTGVYNRSAALDHIETLLATTDKPCMLITLDVDDFKGVNDTYGHPEGDRVLKELGAFLTSVMRKEDIVARMGGDEFLIFAVGLEPGEAANRILEHLSRGPFATQRETDLSDSSKSDGRQGAAPTLSIGAAYCTSGPVAFEDLYAAADEALYEAKAAGKECYKLYATSL